MLMPGRKGYSQDGGWSSGNGGSTLPGNIVYDRRDIDGPLEYKATESIEFVPQFENAEGDVFDAYITNEGSGGNGNELIASGGYRYGFNGKENDNEVKGEGNQQDYGMRIYDPRLGKFLSLDPLVKKYPELTPYQFGSNIPIAGIDKDGLEFEINKMLFDLWIEFQFGGSTGANDLVGGAVQKARVETGQMSYHQNVPKRIENKLDQFNLNEANAKIASGTSKAIAFNIQTSAEISSSLVPLGEIRLGGNFWPKSQNYLVVIQTKH